MEMLLSVDSQTFYDQLCVIEERKTIMRHILEEENFKIWETFALNSNIMNLGFVNL